MKSPLTASHFNSFDGDVMQALPDSSHDQTCDKKIVDTYYLDNCQTMEVQTIDAEQVNQFIMRLKLKFSQYPSIHTNYIIPHCTTLQYNHNI